MKTKKVFTLVEVMIVIAIIAVISSMFLVGWRVYQDRADDFVISSTMNDISSLAESIRARDGNYAKLKDDAELTKMKDNFPGTIKDKFVLHTKADDLGRPNMEYCASIELISGDHYCIDSSFEKGKTDKAKCTKDSVDCK